MNEPVPQRVITISIVGNEKNANVSYSYLSPVTGLSYINSPTCDILVDRPIYTLYLLDYSASLNGWTITGTSPYEDSPTLETVDGALQLSLMTINPGEAHSDYRYYIHYLNTRTDVEIKRDPQELNIPVPI
jgi:hypothetical protein